MTSVTTIGRTTNITITRGDSFYGTVTMTDDSGAYVPADGDQVLFAAENRSGVTVLTKSIPTDTLLLALAPDDTKTLKPGTYRFNIRLIKAGGDVDTFVQGKLKLESEVD